jgi:predicted nuclease of predicted toxin-antitoxin system
MARLLFDEPLSEKLCDMLADVFPGSLHIRLLGHGGAEDATVWEVARSHDCLVVSKDEDFNRLAILRGAPPKFVWVRRGNCATMRSPRFFGSVTGRSFCSTSKRRRPFWN